MKRIIVTILLLCVVISLWACTPNDQNAPTVLTTEPTVTSDPTDPSEPEEINPPEVRLFLNLQKEDYESDLRTFPANRTSSEEYAYVHIQLQGVHESENIRFKLEKRKGQNEKVTGEYEIVEDKIIDIPGDGEYRIRFKITDPSIYFYRVTLYYEEYDIMLATRTIYTPYRNPYYTEADFGDTPPEFHPYNDIVGEEQDFFDKCQYAITDYASSGYYVKVASLIAWQGTNELYMQVVFEVTDGTETVWFAIDNNDPQKYTTGTSPNGLVPSGEMTINKQVQFDFFYICRALTEALFA